MENRLHVQVQLTPFVSFALQQNYVPVLRSLTLRNLTAEPMHALTVRITAEPEFASPFTASLEQLLPDSPVEIAPVKLAVSPEYLFSLTEKVAALLHLEVLAGEECVHRQEIQLDLLAPDQWLGTQHLPEMTAAYITPNHPRITEVIGRAAKFLQKWTGDPSFTGYQTKNPNIVKKQAAAIFAALQEENIVYTMPPASFEGVGQRVRLPHAVLEQKCGTCMDLALLYASCLEAVHLRPLLLFVKGHAFAGLWLEEETFPECVTDDAAAVTKRAAAGIDSICLVECTDFVAGKQCEFDRAERHAGSNLEDEQNFEFVLDILRCRCSGIRPMPVQRNQDGTFAGADLGSRKKNEITGAPKDLDLRLHGAEAEEQTVTRQGIWERKLLDLSLRNSLLNFRPSASNVQLMVSDMAKIEDEMSKGTDLGILPAPQDAAFVLSANKMYEIENERDLVSAIADAEFQNKRLRTFLKETELERILKKLHRQAKVSVEENGANTLYLALGFLKWYETDQSSRPRFAPLVLIPVDLVRNVQKRSYLLRIRGEEIQMNITLLEMLRQFFGIRISGLDPLPMDESGIDLPLVFNTIRKAVMAKKGWDIMEYAFLGQFSFSQFIMWNDIRTRSDELAKNKVVASLIAGKLTWEPQSIEISPSELDRQVSPADMAIPTSADSSQLAAIHAAAKGESFVLHGPPGTGKSQTITNMIANALYQGKSVLFVAEKMAALSVVQKRLAGIGLAPFCLELHSNKTQKRAVLNQLARTLEVGHIKSPEAYAKTAASLKEQREALSGFMEQLHGIQPIGMSMYDAIVKYDANVKYNGTIGLEPDFASACSPDKYAACREAVQKAATAGRECGGFRNTALRLYRKKEYSMEIRDAFEQCAYRLKRLTETECTGWQQLCGRLGLDPAVSHADYAAATELLHSGGSGDYLSGVFRDGARQKDAQLSQLLRDGTAYAALHEKLASEYESSIFNVDASAARLDWKRNEQKWFLPKLLGKNKLLKEMTLHAKNPQSVTEQSYLALCDTLEQYAALKQSVSNADAGLTSVFGSGWNGVNTDFAALSGQYSNSLHLYDRAEGLPQSSGIRAAFSRMGEDAAFRQQTAQSCAGAAELNALLKQLETEYAVDTAPLLADADWLTKLHEAAEGWCREIALLRERTVLQNTLDALHELGLGRLADAFENGSLHEEDLLPALECELSRAVIADVFRKNPALSSFQEAQFEAQLEKYRNTAKEFEALTVQELAARLSSKIPVQGAGGAASSEIAILQKAIRSGGRMLPIRKLFDSIPNLLRRMCPCMLMSPISVAQYIDPAFPKFDLVIFDEASQLPTSEAVGAIARGENVIVVGDPRQLPPTSFFSSNQTDEEHYDQEDLESVLDDCLALSMPQKHLLWHYRSRHESLIAFSNARFYENQLLTFPSPADLVSEVKWVHVEGFYDKGKTKQNPAEAKAVVAEIVRRLRDEQLRRESIGVVTFSVVQQNLIDDLLAEEYINDPELEVYANSMYEPIFIKNLENVQGDERDVILFSVGYGPDKDGKVSMNFGPLNRDGGWRRLNVAVSRARKGMMVFSVIRPEQIDLSRTSSDGVAQLRAFLEFAAKGRTALAVNAGNTAAKTDGFAEELAQEIRRLGFDVRCGIGCSGFRIDAAIIHPDNPERYLLGLICDSSGGLENSTVRDRTILQPSVLEGLGWNLYHVHILEWLDNKERLLSRIKDAAEKALEAERLPAAQEPDAADKPRTYDAFAFEKEEQPAPADSFVKYESCTLPQMGQPEEFQTAKAILCIEEIVRKEAPVCRRSVLKKVLAAWDIHRLGSRTEHVFDEAVRKAEIQITVTNDNQFFWRTDQNPAEYAVFRIPDGTEKRSMEDICAEEIAAAVMCILRTQISTSRADLIRETAKLFGYTRSGGVIEAAVNAGIACAEARGLLTIDSSDKIVLK